MSGAVDDIQSTLPSGEEVHKKQKSTSFLKGLFEVSKKFIDEEIWYVVRRALPDPVVKALNPFLVGGLMIFALAQESYEAIKDFFHAFLDKHYKQRLTRMAAGATILSLGGTGIGLCVTLVAEALGASPVGTLFFPVILPSIMVAIYSVSLARKAYTLHVAIKAEEKARAIYEKKLAINNEEIARLRERIFQCEQLRLSLEQSRSVQRMSESIPDDDYVRIKMQDLNSEKNAALAAITKLEELNEASRKEYEPFLEDRLDAEREVAFATAELATSTVILVSSILGASFIIGASVASFGTFALALLIGGAAVGGAFKLFEFIDEKRDHAMTKWLRGLFSSSPKPKPALEHKQQKTPQLPPKKYPSNDVKGSTSMIFSTIPVAMQPEGTASISEKVTIPHDAEPVVQSEKLGASAESSKKSGSNFFVATNFANAQMPTEISDQAMVDQSIKAEGAVPRAQSVSRN